MTDEASSAACGRHLQPAGKAGAEAERKRTEQSFFVPKAEIAANDYDLSINKYKETEYVAVEYPPTEEILADIEELNRQIDAETAGLRKLLGL